MKAWESSRKKQKEADRHDVIAGSIAILGMSLAFVSAVVLFYGLTLLKGAMFTVGALMLEAGLFLDRIYRLKDGRSK